MAAEVRRPRCLMEGGQSVCRQPGTSPCAHDAYRPKGGVGRRPVSGGDAVAPTHHGNGGDAASQNHGELPPGDLQPEQGLLLRDLAYWCACFAKRVFARRFFARHSRSIRWQPHPRKDHRPAPLGNPCDSRDHATATKGDAISPRCQGLLQLRVRGRPESLKHPLFDRTIGSPERRPRRWTLSRRSRILA